MEKHGNNENIATASAAAKQGFKRRLLRLIELFNRKRFLQFLRAIVHTITGL